jgi:hypothetical protein
MFETLIELIGLVMMFVLRIGVPIALTYFVGRWLEKKFRPVEESNNIIRINEITRRASSGKIIRMHCWDIKRCDAAKRAQCAAFQRPDLPCWLALQVSGHSLHEECFTCAFYKPQTMAA